ncbi:peptidase domain-containing ABC transporter [Psychromonas sp. Urea-02u-13]|uniref:peptidase domain-containing ABC transporter n=1 Tax=Psychromonas sp. Urea-02u-13 TaxID=2058326 RepID=UPI001E659D10|nr:type I secretion system permease/ATPase [Psychromonas sp. Urea-02u-13]
MNTKSANPAALKCCDILLQLNGIKLVPIEFDSKYKELSQYLKQLSKQYGLNIKLSRVQWKKLSVEKLPLAFETVDGDYAVLAKMAEEKVLIQKADKSAPEVISIDELQTLWSSKVIYIPESKLNFDISWFIPEFVRYKGLLSEVLVLSFFLQILALALPLFFQVVMDKVLVHNALSTLDVLVIVLVTVGIFEVVIKGLREYLFVHTTNRIDIRLGLSLFKHLLGLPLSYFKSRQVGVIVTRVKELDSIRNLLTGAALTLLVDVSFIFVFLAVMYYLSAKLTLIILAILPLYLLLGWLTAKPLEKRIEHQFQCGAQNTAFLTETIHGCETVKSLAIEPLFQRKWELQTKEVVQTNFATQTLQAGVSQAVNLLQRVSGVLVIWLGAQMVINLEMTIGQLIAFNMMVSHVNQPMAKLVELWQQFIQTRVAVDKLGDVLNLPTEEGHSDHSPGTKLVGNICFSQVSFKYQPDLPSVLQNISLSIQAGENVAIVGPSGSGKSTITRLIQKLYLAESGQLLIDGQPINQLSAHYIRSQIGVVLQENYLFNLSVRDNIAIKHPTSTFEKIVDVAQLAGAHEFVLQLEKGYDTVLAESGSSLSGGQKQRIAIARALLGNPALLIFDEATSALDDETQQIVLNNMGKITANRTVITIAHRLSTVKHCDRIIFLDKGEIVEQGTHQALLIKKGRYANLWRLQSQVQQENPA